MSVYRSTEVIERAGLPATTGWRRLNRLAVEGTVARRVRIGGSEGTQSVVEYGGSIDELAELVRTMVVRSPAGGPHRCPTCGANRARPRNGPPCPKCGAPSEFGSANNVAWCPECHSGFFVVRNPKPAGGV